MAQTQENEAAIPDVQAIQEDFTKVAGILKKASMIIQQTGQYPYPIFVVSSLPIPFASLLIGKKEKANTWNYYATYLEVLVSHAVVTAVAEFKAHYKDPMQYCCVLFLEQDFASFIYIPYATQQNQLS